MKLKTATVIALVGVTSSYAISLVRSLSHGISGLHAEYLLQGALFNVPLILFLFTLHRKQQ